MAHVLGPNQCRRGEQLGLKIYVHNFDVNQMLVTITLLNSEDYKFVHVGPDGVVASYTARLSGGDHQKLIYVSFETGTRAREFPRFQFQKFRLTDGSRISRRNSFSCGSSSAARLS